MHNARTLAALLALAAGTQAVAQTQPTAPANPAADEVAVAPVPAACCIVANGTVVELEILDLINSSRHKRGDRFALRLVDPVLIDGHALLPAGIIGVGEVVHAMPARGGGKPGELLLAARYLEHQDQQLPLRGLKLGVSGQDNAALALAVSFAAGPFAMFIRGREIEIPIGTRVHAKLAGDMPVSMPTTPAPSAIVPIEE